MKFSEKLMNLRKSKGMSQEELAIKLDVARQTVSKWELDKTVPDMNKLMEIAKLFEVSLDELVNNIETSNQDNMYKENSIEKNNKKISIRILIVGIIITCILCGIGWIKQNNAKKTNEERAQQAYKQSQSAIDTASKRLEEIKTEIIPLQEQYEAKQQEADSMNMRDSNWFSENSRVQREASNINSQISALELEKFKLENTDYTVYFNLVEPIKYLVFYYIGAGIFTATVLISLIYFLVTRKKR